MKVFLIGGTGFLGSAAAEELIGRGHEVKAIALESAPEGARFPQESLALSDDEIRDCFYGCEGFVFAAGINGRITGAPPIHEYFNKFNVYPLQRLMRIAKECGVKNTVICGSYFSYFDKKWENLELSRWHPYIRSLRDQEKMALSFADDNFNVAILELPCVFGNQNEREPVWTIIVKAVRSMPFVTLSPKGGTTMITKNQAAQAIAGALERSRGGKCWRIGCYNIPWKDFLAVVHREMGMPGKKVITIPKWLLNLGIKYIEKKRKEARGNNECGIFLPKFSGLLSAETYIDRTHGCIPLGVKDDDIERAIGESIRYSAAFIRRGSNP
ncbi:MAG: NAD(P)-dependent oxidoreductase [Treponema sp.]|jgi:nucleoside-diphosphate-sugar epimerase|nr:NAD(P)-dependent oxidoreductase [Treponema sp.]